MNSPRLAGFELYFDDLKAATHFYRDTLGLKLSGEQPGHHAQFSSGGIFLCLEAKGAEPYSSRDKAVVFLHVDNLEAAIERIGRARFVEIANNGRGHWAVLHDPEGHNVGPDREQNGQTGKKPAGKIGRAVTLVRL